MSRHIRFDPDECIVCGVCDPECPVEALQFLIAFVNDEVNRQQLTVDLKRCIECGDCIAVCPTDALVLEIRDEPDIGNGNDTGNGPGSGSGNNNSNPNKPPSKIKYKNMPQSLREEIEDYLENMNPCSRAALVEKLQSGKHDIFFNFNENAGFLGFYNQADKTLNFGSESIINAELLSHEMFHAFQDQTYANMGNYGKGKNPGDPNKPGHVNIEFEQYLFQSISFQMDSYGSMVGNQFSNQSVGAEYRTWIQQIMNSTNGQGQRPNLSTFPNFIQDYNKFLNLYNQYGPASYRSQLLNMSPQSLLGIMDGGGC